VPCGPATFSAVSTSTPSTGQPVHRLRADRVDWRQVDGEVVALDRQSSQYLAINATGAVVWTELVEGATADQLVDAVTARFEVSPEQARRDVEGFLADLARRRLLVT
jgi:hypothetical protein